MDELEILRSISCALELMMKVAQMLGNVVEHSYVPSRCWHDFFDNLESPLDHGA